MFFIRQFPFVFLFFQHCLYSNQFWLTVILIYENTTNELQNGNVKWLNPQKYILTTKFFALKALAVRISCFQIPKPPIKNTKNKWVICLNRTPNVCCQTRSLTFECARIVNDSHYISWVHFVDKTHASCNRIHSELYQQSQ